MDKLILRPIQEDIVLRLIGFINSTDKTQRHHGKDWYYCTYESWHKIIPAASITTIKRHMMFLEELGIIVSGCFNSKRYDRTKWYAIDYEQLHELCGDRYIVTKIKF